MEVSGWGGSRFHSDFLENRPKIAVTQYSYFGVVGRIPLCNLFVYNVHC